MMTKSRFFCCFLVCTCIATVSEARLWTDTSGKYTLEADLVGFDDENVILQRKDKELGSIRIEQLSKEDQEFLKTKEAEIADNKNINEVQKWKTQSGVTLIGRIVDYAKKDVTIQRRRNKMYVGDRVFENLPQIYQKMLPEIVAHFEGIDPTEQAMQRWLLRTRGQPITFTLEGVILELEDGDEYGIPFFIFTEGEQTILKKGWKSWLAVHDKHDERDDEAFRFEAMMAAYKKNEEQNRRIATMNLQLQGVRAGLFSLWEVTLYPVQGNAHPPMWVVYPGRDSQQAINQALAAHPGFAIGSVRRVSH